MYYILFIIGIIYLIVTLMRRPQARLFWQTRIAPLVQRGVQSIQQAKDRIVSNPKTKRRMIWIATAFLLIILALIFR